jgi:hypothetical protein
MWSEKGNTGHGAVESGHPGSWNSSAAALLAYDVPHRAPWDWRVSAYTWTKGIAAGAYLVPLLLALAGVIGWDSMPWTWALDPGAFSPRPASCCCWTSSIRSGSTMFLRRTVRGSAGRSDRLGLVFGLRMTVTDLEQRQPWDRVAREACVAGLPPRS